MARRSSTIKNQSSRKIEAGFKSIQIFNDQTLSKGAYGRVYLAKSDDLLCAAKMLHPIFIDNELVRRFEQECELLSTLRHPNIVQYIGMYSDPDTKLPVLLMELMDENLTHYLERSSQPVPYHLQVNICHNVASALSFIHANDIIHRDICSHNILLTGNAEVIKVCDFAVSAFDISYHDDLMKCPGAPMYMPPETMTEDPKYTEKIDCFSFGVIVVQV